MRILSDTHHSADGIKSADNSVDHGTQVLDYWLFHLLFGVLYGASNQAFQIIIHLQSKNGWREQSNGFCCLPLRFRLLQGQCIWGQKADPKDYSPSEISIPKLLNR